MKWIAFGVAIAGVGVQTTDVSGFKSWARLTPKPVAVSDPSSGYCAQIITNKRSTHDGYLINVYVNQTGQKTAVSATEALKSKAKAEVSFPEGSILLKTKFRDKESRTFRPRYDPSLKYEIELMTVMTKLAKGASPKTGDWKFEIRDGSGTKLWKTDQAKCYSCHRDNAADAAFLRYGNH